MAHRALVVIEPYTHHWPAMFRAERAELLAALTPGLFQIEPIGSTAVPGLAAKPIIDVLLGARALSDIEVHIETLRRLGYQYMPEHEAEMPQRRFFATPLVRPRHFHLHAVVLGGRFWNEHLLFRDALRGNVALAEDYAALKRSLAALYKDDRESYTHGKSAFIASAISDAQQRLNQA